MNLGAWTLVVAVVAVLSFGAFRAAVDGRFRGTHQVRGAGPAEQQEAPRTSLLEGTRWADQLGEKATLLQFSSAFCAPCRATRRVLEGVSATRPGVAHVEIDAEHHLDVVRRLGILRTPTTLVLDAAGSEIARASGTPRPEQVTAVLD